VLLVENSEALDLIQECRISEPSFVKLAKGMTGNTIRCFDEEL
jgi:hypothetical protein